MHARTVMQQRKGEGKKVKGKRDRQPLSAGEGRASCMEKGGGKECLPSMREGN